MDNKRNMGDCTDQKTVPKRNKLIAIILVIIVVISVLIIYFFLVLPKSNNCNVEEELNNYGVSNNIKQTDNIETTEQNSILYGNDEALDEAVPNNGEYVLSSGLSEALSKPDNTNAVFFVALEIYDSNGDQIFYEDFVYESMTRQGWEEYLEQMLSEYNEGYIEFSSEKETEIDWSNIKTTEEKEKVYLDIQSEWDDIWNKTHNINPKSKFQEFEQAYQLAREKRIQEIIEDESKRLGSLGLEMKSVYDNESKSCQFTAYLTSNQIEDFSAGEYGYVIRWADKDDAVDA